MSDAFVKESVNKSLKSVKSNKQLSKPKHYKSDLNLAKQLLQENLNLK